MGVVDSSSIRTRRSECLRARRCGRVAHSTTAFCFAHLLPLVGVDADGAISADVLGERHHARLGGVLLSSRAPISLPWLTARPTTSTVTSQADTRTPAGGGHHHAGLMPSSHIH